MTNHIDTFPYNNVFAYRAVATEDNTVGGGNIDFRCAMPVGVPGILLAMMIGPDNYATARNVQVNYRDTATGNIIGALYTDNAIDNERVTIPQKETAAGENKLILANATQIVLGGLDAIRVICTAAIVAETLTIAVRFSMKYALRPTITWVAGGARPLVVAVDYDGFR